MSERVCGVLFVIATLFVIGFGGNWALHVMLENGLMHLWSPYWR